MKNLLSICCLGYNHEKYLSYNLESISKINYDNIEVIVIDDGSQDNSIKLLNEIKKNYPFPIKIISQENTGNIGKNFNTAYKTAKGNFISFISLDDQFNPEIMDKLIKNISENPEYAFVSPTYPVAINSEGNILNTEDPYYIENYNITANELLELEYSRFGFTYLQGIIFRKEIIDAVNGFDEDVIGDDLILRTKVLLYIIENPNWKFNFIKGNSIFYRIHDNNIHKNSIRQIQIVTEYLERFWSDREDPKILIEWAKGVIHSVSFEKIFIIFTLNKRASKLINNNEIQREIIKRVCKNTIFYKTIKNLFNYIYQKKKFGENRKITLFRLIKISYKK